MHLPHRDVSFFSFGISTQGRHGYETRFGHTKAPASLLFHAIHTHMSDSRNSGTLDSNEKITVLDKWAQNLGQKWFFIFVNVLGPCWIFLESASTWVQYFLPNWCENIKSKHVARFFSGKKRLWRESVDGPAVTQPSVDPSFQAA